MTRELIEADRGILQFRFVSRLCCSSARIGWTVSTFEQKDERSNIIFQVLIKIGSQRSSSTWTFLGVRPWRMILGKK